MSLVVSIGEVLWDVFSGRKRLGGASANFLWHCSQLGAEVGLEQIFLLILCRFQSCMAVKLFWLISILKIKDIRCSFHNLFAKA
jgi:hypothetical protein